MKWLTSSRVAVFAAVALMGAAVGLADLATNSTAPAARPAEPQMVVYRGNDKSCRDEVDAYAEWIGRPDIWGEGFAGSEHWTSISNPAWLLEPWEKWLKQREGRKMLLSVPMLPGPWDLSGPLIGPGAKQRVSHALGARREYNQYFVDLAKDLVKRDMAKRVIVRLGWEFNGSWYTWRVDKKETKEYTEYFRQIVKAMRAVPGAEKLQICWNPALMRMPYTKDAVYPGDDVVDYIGLDAYDECWIKDVYPYPKEASDEEILNRQKQAWDKAIGPDLQAWKKFAQEHNKPLCFPEWGVWQRSNNHGGLDNPLYIERMHEFIMNPDNHVAFYCYFEVVAHDGDHQLSPGREGKHVTQFPKSAARFLELFGRKTGATTQMR